MTIKLSCPLVVCFVLLGASPALAQEVASTPQQQPSAIDPVSTDAIDPMAVLASIDDQELADLRGGETVVLTNQTMVAVTAGNVINGDYVAGSVSLSDFALSNFNGVGNLLINTGAQVSLQTGMNLTINVGE